ncbi:hypothetical protein KUTeg_019966 [Tegillarca granosa]|uniref:Major facilitator superfamily (MFS) profile domain-containing protein n=1 Tax=Tegillarca granosa TaxID=220873 RepID=A0ABQ9EJJ4_TEGGR|nr:hypothetical protein KUTeg_019966 [Tegillarca granosa]
MADKKNHLTCTLLFSTIIAIFGNSFLYGYNIGAVNNPAEVVRRFYARILLERAGLLHHHDDESINNNMTTLKTTSSPVTVASFINSSSLSGNESITDEKEIEKEVEEDPVLELLWAITVAIFVLFGMFGAFGSSKIADHFGRKKGMILITFFMFIAGILGAIPKAINSFEVIIVHRAFVGLHCGLSMSLVSLYIAEISPKQIRGALGACHQLFITIGILSSNIIGVRQLTGNDRLWPFVFAFNAFPSFVCLVCMPFCPESPRFLLINKKQEADARKAMQRLRGYDDMEDEMDEMKIEASKMQSVKAFSIKQLLVTPGLRLPTFIATMSMAAQQLSGINAVMSYSSFMFKNAGVPDNIIQWVDNHSAFAVIGIISMHTYVIGFAIGLGM